MIAKRVGEFKRKVVNGVPFCVDCDSEISDFPSGRGGKPMRCRKCRKLREASIVGKQSAHTAVARAIRHGEIKRPSEFDCVDCGKPASVYDHRDYSKPLDVQPVCRSCNVLRGSVIDQKAA